MIIETKVDIALEPSELQAHPIIGEIRRDPAAHVVIFYHGVDHDGIASAWLLKQHLALGLACRCIPRDYPDAPLVGGNPLLAEINDTDVFFVDFSPTEAELAELALVCRRVVVLDHHKSAPERMGMDMSGMPEGDVFRLVEHHADGPLLIVDSGRRAGVGLVAEFVGVLLSPHLQYVEDADLWTKRFPDTSAVSAWLGCYPMEVNTIGKFLEVPIGDVVAQGRAILAFKHQLRDDAVRTAYVFTPAIWNGWPRKYTYIACECPLKAIVSMVGHALCQPDRFPGKGEANTRVAVVWRRGFTPAGESCVFVSLRSDSSGPDVGALAASFGGGGHVHAAGLTLLDREHPQLTHAITQTREV